MKPERSEVEIIEELEALAAMSDEDINYDDIPPTRDFAGFVIGAHSGQPVRVPEVLPSRIELFPWPGEPIPVVRGTRVAVRAVVDLLKQGSTVEDLLARYRQLCADDVYAVIQMMATVMTEGKAAA